MLEKKSRRAHFLSKKSDDDDTYFAHCMQFSACTEYLMHMFTFTFPKVSDFNAHDDQFENNEQAKKLNLSS